MCSIGSSIVDGGRDRISKHGDGGGGDGQFVDTFFSFGDEYLSSSGRWKSCVTYINIANGDTATHFEYGFSWGELGEERDGSGLRLSKRLRAWDGGRQNFRKKTCQKQNLVSARGKEVVGSLQGLGILNVVLAGAGGNWAGIC